MKAEKDVLELPSQRTGRLVTVSALALVLTLMQESTGSDADVRCRSHLGLFTESEFNLNTCSWCYGFLFQGGRKPLSPNTIDNYLTVMVNTSQLTVGTKLLPDPDNQTSRDSICATLTEDECVAWSSCCATAKLCCQRQLQTGSDVIGNTTCPGTWDGFGCWEAADAGTQNSIMCPSFIKFSVPTRTATKTCTEDGSWLTISNREWTNYSSCFQRQESTTPSSGKRCKSKFGLFPQPSFNLHTCGWCYGFLFQKLRKPLLPSLRDVYLTAIFNTSEITVGTQLLPDPDNQTSRDLVCTTLTEDECITWASCCADAKQCCQRQLERGSDVIDNKTCAGTWDGFGCWDTAVAGTRNYITCPSFLKFSVPSKMAIKTCMNDGSWFRLNAQEWTDYTPCLQYEELRMTIFIGVGCQVASLVLLIPSLAIFLHYKQLRNQHRIRLHINFFISFILNGVATILWNVLVTYGKLTNPEVTETLIYRNLASCKVLSFLKLYFTSTNYVWVFCEGFYLYRLIANAFSPPKRLIWLYVAGWGIPFIYTMVYAVVRLAKANESCWTISLGGMEWIMYAPNLACLAANIYFLSSVLRILLTQLQSHPNEPSNFRRAIKATFVLIPLFGVQLVVIIYRLPPASPGAIHYERFSEVVSNSQGFVVALIYCLCNSEVLSQIKRSVRHVRFEVPSGSRRFTASMIFNFNHSTTRRSIDIGRTDERQSLEPCLKTDATSETIQSRF